MAKLTPPDRTRCQAEIGGAFMLGPGGMRCSEAAAFIVTEKKPGKDKKRGSMSLCASCKGAFEKRRPVEDYTFEALAAEPKPKRKRSGPTK